MTGLPEGVLRPVEDAGEAPLGSLLTAGERAYVTPEGVETVLPVWFVVSATRAWLIAGDTDARWSHAVGTPEAVSVARGWSWDQLHVGAQSTPLRRGTRAAAEALVERFVGAGGGGTPHPPPPPQDLPERAPAARGADDLPGWIPTSVPADPEERWLHAARTASLQPFNAADGSVARAPIWIAHTDRRSVLVARSGDGAVWWQGLTGRVVHQPRAGSDRLQADSRELWGPRLADRGVEVSAAVSAARRPGARWAVVAEAALDDGRPRHAVRLITEGLRGGHAETWRVLARVLFKAGAPELAAAAAAKALSVTPQLDVDAEVSAWNGAGDVRALRRQDVDVSFVRGSLRSEIASLGVPEPPDGLPWPPQRPDAVWAAALAMQARFADASALWGDRQQTARQLAAVAALKTAQRADDAAEAWVHAAEAARHAGAADASAALDRAIALDPVPRSLWLRASWAWEDGDGIEARRHWLAAVLVDPRSAHGVALPPEARRALARHAEAEGEWEAAATAWRQAAAAVPDDAEAWRRAATLLETRLDQPAEAAAVLETYLDHHGTILHPPEAAWQVRRDLAALQLRAGLGEAATRTLRTLVAEDYLHPDALLAALTLGESLELPLRWWSHLRSALLGSDDGSPRAPRTDLTTDEMDALHPGGVTFLERMRQGLHGSQAPDRATLVRGLERLTEARDPRVWGAVKSLCEALDMPAPDVFLFRGDGAWGCSAWATDPPMLLVGVEHLEPGPRELSDGGLRFLLAVELVHLRCEHPVLFFDTDILGTSRSMYSSFGRYAGTAESIVDVVTLVPGIDQLAKLQTVLSLSRRVFATRSAIDKASGLAGPVLDRLGLGGDGADGGVGREGLEGAALAFRVQADRVALLLVGDARAAIDAILLSSRSLDGSAAVAKRGLATVLADDPPAEALRITALLAFAASLGPT